MPDGPPLVTVVIPCFNQARYLASSVASARRQSYSRVRTLVVDDGSTDGTAAAAARLKVEVVGQENRGLSEARNAGLAAAGGEFVIFLDADDELLDDAVERGVDALRGAPAAICAVGRCVGVDEDGGPRPAEAAPPDTSDLYRAWLQENFVWTVAAAIFRREQFQKKGGFPPGLGPAADYAVYLALARERLVVDHGNPVARYRQHDASMSRNPALMLRSTLAVLRRERRVMPAHYHADYARGVRRWRDWYGEQLIERLRRECRDGAIRPAHLSTIATLIAHSPRTLLRHAGRKLRVLLHRGGRSAAAMEEHGA